MQINASIRTSSQSGESANVTIESPFESTEEYQELCMFKDGFPDEEWQAFRSKIVQGVIDAVAGKDAALCQVCTSNKLNLCNIS